MKQNGVVFKPGPALLLSLFLLEYLISGPKSYRAFRETGHRPLVLARLYAFPLTSPIFQSPKAHTQNFSHPPPPNIFIPFSILNKRLALSMSIQILSKISEKPSLTESLTTLKISTSIFSTFDKTYYNHHFTSTQYLPKQLFFVTSY